MLARSSTLPVEVKRLPAVLARLRVNGGTLPRAVINPHFHRFQWRSVIQCKAADAVTIGAALGNPRDDGLQVHTSNGIFYPALLIADHFALERHIIATHKTTHVAGLLYMDLGQPFNVSDPIEPRHQQAYRT